MVKDERIGLVDPTVAEQLLDDAIRHGTYLERFKAHEVRQLLKVLESEVLPDLTEQVSGRLAAIAARGYDRGPETTARLEAMKAAIERVLEQGSARMKAALRRDLEPLAEHEAKWQRARLEAAVPIDLHFRLPESAMLRQLVGGHPIQGEVLEDWFSKMETGVATRVTSELTIGVAEGQTLQQLMGRLDGVIDDTRSVVEATARTFVTGVSARAREDFAAENDDLIDGMRWISTLDHRTCIQCAPLDGEVFPVNEGPRPPRHPNCRCTVVPVLKPWGKLGGLPPGQRAAAGGPVADTVTFEGWLGDQPASVQDDILGVTKGKAFRAGDLTLAQMLDQSGRPLTLDELIAKDLL